MNEPFDTRQNTPQAPSIYPDSEIVGHGLPPFFEFPTEFPFAVGKYSVLERVGEGGAGIVFKAVASFRMPICNVAIKFIRPDLIASHSAIRRFHKESRLHAAVDSPYVSRHIEMGEWNGRLYIVSEFVEGFVLSRIYKDLSNHAPRLPLLVARDVLRALSAIHEGGVIHRDVKPANIIVDFKTNAVGSSLSEDTFEFAKLTDFGLARHIEQSESLELTRPTAILGTPCFMAPEQLEDCQSVDGRADIYSLGVTLYTLLSGELPFDNSKPESIRSWQQFENPKPLFQVRPKLAEAVSRVVEKAMAKEPDARYQDAQSMLSDIESLLANRPIGLSPFPAVPVGESASPNLYFFEWELDAPVENLWPFVSDTNRVNHAIGLPAPEFTFKHYDDAHEIYAKANFNGMTVRWQEFPFQWIVNRCMSVLRIFDAGPFQWVTSTVELEPLTQNRTRLVHRFQVLPRGLLGKLLTPFQFSLATKRSLGRLYKRIEKLAQYRNNRLSCDVPFSQKISKCNRKLLESRIFELEHTVAHSRIPWRLQQYLSTAAESFVAKIRPRVFATKTENNLQECLEVFLRAVDTAILKLGWDVVCPICRVSATTVDTFEKIESHTYCPVCDSRFEVDFGKQVEMIFTVHPEIRTTSSQIYCIGGPFHSPHVLAQQRIASNSTTDICLPLSSGAYAITCPTLLEPIFFEVDDSALATRLEIECENPNHHKLPTVKAGTVCVSISNSIDRELLVKLENRLSSEKALLAFEAANNPLFAELFPGEARICKSQLVSKSVDNLFLIKRVDSDPTPRENATGGEKTSELRADINMRAYWQSIENYLGLETHEILEAGYEQLIFRCATLRELTVRLERILSTDFAINLGPVSIAIHRGDVVEFADKTNLGYGQANRKIAKVMQDCNAAGLLFVGPEIDQPISDHFAGREILRPIANDDTDANTPNAFRIYQLVEKLNEKEPPNQSNG